MRAARPRLTVGAHPGTELGGLVLQGGHGALERTTGLSIDSLVSCTVVLASGEVVTASVKENTDLFWALRGGCGNFGVVVSFTFKLHKIGEGGSVMQSQRVHLPFTPMVKLLGWPTARRASGRGATRCRRPVSRRRCTAR